MKSNGVLIVKENMTSTGEVEKDEEDSSVTRPESKLRELFEKAGLEVVRDLMQQKFPQDLFKVKMFALRPKAQ